MSLKTAFEMGLIRPVIQSIADILTSGISVKMIPENREPFINLPGLRGYWPMSIAKYTGEAIDHSGASSDLTRVGAPQFGYDDDSYMQVGVSTDYLTGFTTQQSVTGLEAWIDPAIRGMTLGCWIYLDVTPPPNKGIISKWQVSPQRSYSLHFTTGSALAFLVTLNGTSVIFVTGSVIPVQTWTFVAGRFTPSTEIALFINDAKFTNTTTIPASLNVSTAVFEVGRVSAADANILKAKIRDVFLCQTILTDDQVETLRRNSLPNT